MVTRKQRRGTGRISPALLLVIAALSGCATVGDRAEELATSGSGGTVDTAPAGPSAHLGSIDGVAAAGQTTTSTVPITTTTPPTTVPSTTTVTWRPPRVPGTVEGMQSYLKQKVGCDTIVPTDDIEPHSFGCQNAEPGGFDDFDAVYGVPSGDEADLAAGLVVDDARGRFDAVWYGFNLARSFRDGGRVDGAPVGEESDGGCWIVASAGAWELSYAEYSLRPGARSEIAYVIEDLDAVVHEDCGMPDLGPDTITLVDKIGGTPTCAPVEVALPAGGPSADGVVDWADYDTAFTCSNGYSMVRVPPGTVDSFGRWSEAQIGCLPYVAVGRWVIHQSATTAMPADYDQSVLIGIGMTYGTYVVNPCTP